MFATMIRAENIVLAQTSSSSAAKKASGLDTPPHQKSPCSDQFLKHVVFVMDGLKEFTTESLEWFLKNIPHEAESCTVTLLGVMPWLNIPLSSKTWSDIWNLDLEDLSIIAERKNDPKYQKVQRLLRLCRFYGVKPQIKSEMGYPLQLLTVEHIISLHPTLIVFDRHHYKYKNYYAGKLPCNIVMMNEEGEMETIKVRCSNDENTPQNSHSSTTSSPISMISGLLKKIFKLRALETYA